MLPKCPAVIDLCLYGSKGIYRSGSESGAQRFKQALYSRLMNGMLLTYIPKFITTLFYLFHTKCIPECPVRGNSFISALAALH